MTQSVRNKIYGVAVAVFGVLALLGFIDEAQRDEAESLLNAILEQADALIGLGVSVLAFVKSLTSKVTTIEAPNAEVAVVKTNDGTVAGPALAVQDGTPVDVYVAGE
jgi:hypothetical protein